MKPLFWIWKWPVTPYSLLMALGIVAGSALFVWFGRKRWGVDGAFDALIWSMAGGLISGRLGFVVANREYFLENFREAWQFWRGGLSFSAALAGGLLALALFARLKKLNLMELLDNASLALAAAQALGWWACHTAGFAYGREWRGFLAFFLPDVYGVRAYRFPVQAAGAIWSALLFIVLLVLRFRKDGAGRIFLAYAFGYLPFDFLLRFLRGDVTRIAGPFEPGQFVLALTIGLAILLRFTQRSSSEL